MKTSARNVLKGKVKSIASGPVSSEITIKLEGGEEIVSVITSASVRHLELKEGKEVYAVIKASNVIIATN